MKKVTVDTEVLDLIKRITMYADDKLRVIDELCNFLIHCAEEQKVDWGSEQIIRDSLKKVRCRLM